MRQGLCVLVFVISAGTLAAAGCGGSGDDPADVGGVYTLNVTNSVDECMVQSWSAGQQSPGIVTLTLTQLASDASKVNGVVKGVGLPGAVVDLYLQLAYGSNEFAGQVTGKRVSMDIVGGRTSMMDGCTFTTTANVDAEVDNDTITGSIFYQFKTNNVPACAHRNTCKNTQNFNGIRPPR
jgi:hypothetical protein